LNEKDEKKWRSNERTEEKFGGIVSEYEIMEKQS